MKKAQKFQIQAEKLTSKLRNIISKMPEKGLKEEDCQRLYLLNRLSEFEYAINGVSENDFKTKFEVYLEKDSHYFSEGHLSVWFKDRYAEKTKSEILFDLEVNHDNSLEIETAEEEIGTSLTNEEKLILINKFIKSVLSNISFYRGKAMCYTDSLGNKNF